MPKMLRFAVRLARPAVMGTVLVGVVAVIAFAAPPSNPLLVSDAFDHAQRDLVPVGGCGQAVDGSYEIPGDLADRAARMAGPGWLVPGQIWFGDTSSLSSVFRGEIAARDRAGNVALRSVNADGHAVVREIRSMKLPSGTAWFIGRSVETIDCDFSDT